MERNYAKNTYTKDKNVPSSQELMQDAAIQALIKPRLNQDEKVLWIGKPHKGLYEKWKQKEQTKDKIIKVIWAIVRPILIVIYIFFMLMFVMYAINGENPIHDLLLVLFFGFVFGGPLFFNGKSEKEADDTLYVITDQDVIVFRADKTVQRVDNIIISSGVGADGKEGIKVNVFETKNINGISYNKVKLSVRYRDYENDLVEKDILLYYVRTEDLDKAAQISKWQKGK